MKFRYEAMDDRGHEIKDVVEAATETVAADIIRSRNQYPIKVTPVTRYDVIPPKTEKTASWWTRLFREQERLPRQPLEVTFTKDEAIKALRRATHGDNEELVEDFSGELDQVVRRRDRDGELDRALTEGVDS